MTRMPRLATDPRLAAIPLIAATVLIGSSRAPAETEGGGEGGIDLPATIDVTGVVRDFREKTEEGGQADMGNRPSSGFGRYSNNVSVTLDETRKPTFTGEGFKVTNQWRDSEHRQICRLLYDASLGDVEGSPGQESTGGITSAESFAQWYTDVPGINISAPLTLTLVLQDDGHYVFDDETDPLYSALGGFFPLDDQYFGNTPKQQHNFHFTFEMHLAFQYDESGDQYFKFIGDDDVWVYIDDRLVVDLGGVHAAHDQYVAMDRLGLSDGEEYTIDFFFAERFTPQSNFRIETNIPVWNADMPSVTAAFD